MFYTKNNRKITHFNKLLIALTAFLAISYFLSFTKSCSSGDRREKIKSALVNQKYLENISFITLQDASGALELNNYKGFWTLQRLSDYTSSQLQTTPSIPLSPERVNNFLNELTNIRNLYKISDKITENSTFGLSNGTEFHLRYYTDSGFHELVFGNQDFALSSRYLMTEKSTQVYETDSSLDPYLTSSLQSWAEPYLISRAAALSTDIQSTSVIFTNPEENGGKKTALISDINKLIELRHGGGVSESERESIKNLTPSMEIFLENGDKSSIKLEICPSENQDISYIVKAEYFNNQPATNSKSPYYTSYSKISSWTYNKIKEITL